MAQIIRTYSFRVSEVRLKKSKLKLVCVSYLILDVLITLTVDGATCNLTAKAIIVMRIPF